MKRNIKQITVVVFILAETLLICTTSTGTPAYY